MEYSLIMFQTLFAFLFILMMIKHLKPSKTYHLTANLPPGPRKLPLVGNIFDVVGPLPHHTLRNLAQKYGPLMHLQLGENSTIVVSSAETAKEVMKTHDVNFANRPFLLAAHIISYKSTNIMFSPYGDYWRQLRRICNSELLSAKHVQSLKPIREQEVFHLIQTIFKQSGSQINLSEHIYALTYGITTRSVFGKKIKHQDALISLIDEAIGLSGGFNLTDLYPSSKVVALFSRLRPKLEKLHQRFDKMLDEIIGEHQEYEERKENPDHLLVDVLLKLQEHGNLEIPLTMDNIKAIILDVLSAGSDTSSTVIEWAMSELLKTPSIMDKVQTEVREVFSKQTMVDETGIQSLVFLKAVIKETLRLHPPAPLMLPMENKEKCEITGYDIPKQTRVIVNIWAIGRDPKYWKDPERFDPERFLDGSNSIDFRGVDFEYIPFGAGRRICPGISFGLANLELSLASLLYHFDWKLATMNGDHLDMIESFGATVKRKNVLNLVPTICYPPPACLVSS
uniref:desmethyl-deoxy-podophyllotoxin synthase-like n=1 Tax=Erigeron canadensis TaxID=72917 RepID=UPI001CB88CB6|nr:desmethyl-deoxy-podophyllotoxin synthase-like [Erigeron canadensis]